MTKDSERMPPCPKIVQGQQCLTSEQEEYARQFTQERITRMLTPTAIDEQEAEMHLREAYRVAGFHPPDTIRWFDSPIPFVLACVMDNNEWKYIVGNMHQNVRSSVMNDLLGSVNKNVWASVYKSMENSMMTGLGQILWQIADIAWDSMDAHIGNLRTFAQGGKKASLSFTPLLFSGNTAPFRDLIQQIRQSSNRGKSIWANIDPREREGVGEYVHDLTQASVCAYYDACWHAFYRFFHEVFQENALIHWASFNEMVSGFRLGSKEAWLVRKPILLERDEQSRLHHASGRCVAYRDGWGFFAWHGVHVPEKLIVHPEAITKEDWMHASDAVRLVIQERLSDDRFVEMLGGKWIDKGVQGKLIAVCIDEDDPECVVHYVQVQDASTQQRHFLRVPFWINRADEAVAWASDPDNRDY
ncbi:hypothetical protein KSF_096710 [Reticulibacter mediterranei]|uniref:DUF6745 domain-containing protein n=1 Tax=Reticulibacter mediterranei TaxID=2778369 RepID=A0A8J3N8E8_9CHLR|nr:hypothetical protein [Reticulibacter mediterranei]GHO99623.1 hypothetical protein KSF_096710 [Reticulibacter mediterranei]